MLGGVLGSDGKVIAFKMERNLAGLKNREMNYNCPKSFSTVWEESDVASLGSTKNWSEHAFQGTFDVSIGSDGVYRVSRMIGSGVFGKVFLMRRFSYRKSYRVQEGSPASRSALAEPTNGFMGNGGPSNFSKIGRAAWQR